MSTAKVITILHPSSAVNNIVNDASGNVTLGNNLAVTGTLTVAGSPITGGGVINFQTFTSSGTWTKPSGYAAGSRVLIQAWGGGGSGGKGGTANACGAGGGGYNERWITLSAMGATETITIAAGGAAQTVTDTSGNVGGTTTVGSLVSAYGGGPGFYAGGGSGGGGGQLSAGTLFVNGNPWGTITAGTGWFWGGTGSTGSTGGGFSSVWGGGGGGGSGTGVAGGASSFAGAGGAGASASSGTAGTQPGGGGGATTSGAASGAGGAGQVLITVFPA